jgi:hypothetical protein
MMTTTTSRTSRPAQRGPELAADAIDGGVQAVSGSMRSGPPQHARQGGWSTDDLGPDGRRLAVATRWTRRRIDQDRRWAIGSARDGTPRCVASRCPVHSATSVPVGTLVGHVGERMCGIAGYARVSRSSRGSARRPTWPVRSTTMAPGARARRAPMARSVTGPPLERRSPSASSGWRSSTTVKRNQPMVEPGRAALDERRIYNTSP